MSLTKRWLEDLSVKMGYDGAITEEFLDELREDPNCLFPPKADKADYALDDAALDDEDDHRVE